MKQILDKKISLPKEKIKVKQKNTENIWKRVLNKTRESFSFVLWQNKKGKIKTKQENNKRKIHKWIATSAGVVALVGLLAVALTFMDIKLGHEVIVNGKTIGIIDNTENFNEILADVKNLTSIATKGEEKQFDVKLMPKIIKGKSITTDYELRQNLLADCDNMIEGIAVYVNGALMAGSLNEAEVYAVLDEIKNSYIGKNEATKVEFVDDVVPQEELVPITQVYNKKDLKKILLGKNKRKEVYEVQEGDSFAYIAEKFDMTEKELDDINKEINKKITIGDKINVLNSQQKIRVRTEYIEKYIAEIDYKTKEVKDNNRYKGQKVITQQGVPGEMETTSTVIKINDEELDRIPITEKRKKQPVTKVVAIGTRQAPKELPVVDDYISADNSGWIRPCSGPVTSKMGYRWGRLHAGYDIGGKYGAGIYAATGGKVLSAKYDGAYGNCVKVSVGNGTVVLYAHMSKMSVKAGQIVEKGQLLGRIGSTGRSTGPHLHFEVRVNGVAVNPAKYVKF